MKKIKLNLQNKILLLNKKFDHDMREVLAKSSLALALKLISALFILVFNYLLARMIGPEGSGIYFLSITVATIATLFGRVGLDDTLVRFTAANVAIQNWSAVKGLYQKGMTLALGASSISALIVFITAPWLARVIFSKPELTEPLLWISISIVPTTMMILHAQMLQGLRRIIEYLIVQWQGIGVSVLSIAGILLFGRNWGVVGAIWALILSTLLMAIIGVWRWHAATPQLRNVTGQFKMQDLLQSSMPLFWVTTMNYVINAGSTSIMLGIWWTNKDVGIYSIATRTAQLTSLILVAINAISAPKFAALYQKGEITKLGKIARQSNMLGIIVSSPLLLIFIIFPQRVLEVYGTGFSQGSLVLTIMAIGQFVNVAAGSVGYLLKMCGKEELLKRTSIHTAILNVTLNLALIPFFGIIGAAVADSLTLIYKNVYASILVRKHLKIKVFHLLS